VPAARVLGVRLARLAHVTVAEIRRGAQFAAFACVARVARARAVALATGTAHAVVRALAALHAGAVVVLRGAAAAIVATPETLLGGVRAAALSVTRDAIVAATVAGARSADATWALLDAALAEEVGLALEASLAWEAATLPETAFKVGEAAAKVRPSVRASAVATVRAAGR